MIMFGVLAIMGSFFIPLNYKIPVILFGAPVLIGIAVLSFLAFKTIDKFSDKSKVTDEQNRVKGYKNMLVVDASMISANLGVNPALSITALSEKAMSFIPVKKSEKIKFLKVEKQWEVTELLIP